MKPSNPRTIPIGITKVIAADYARRNAFPELRPGQPWYVRTFPAYELYHTADCKLVFKVLDDANEQGLIKRGRKGVGITLAYRALARKTLRHLRRVIDFDPAYIFHPMSSSFGGCDWRCAHVEGLFLRLGIPLAHAENGSVK